MSDPSWWRRGVLYEIYPRSFQDSDGDGVGDLAGIRRRLDYLSELGVDASIRCSARLSTSMPCSQMPTRAD